MPIDKLTISNFKGIDEKTEFIIKPLTLFIGPNSSGKSSCIHALAALAQTVKLASSKLPIVLDDEFAQVHLGRFIEVIHSKSYDDQMEIGVSLNKPGIKVEYEEAREVINSIDDIQAIYSFKSTKRTQDITMEKAEFNVGKKNLTFIKTPKDYSVSFNSNILNTKARHRSGLKLSFTPTLSPTSTSIEAENDQRSLFDAFVLNETIAEIILGELRKTLYLGPFRQAPLRRYQTRGSSPLEVGSQGEASVTLLANEYVQSKARTHIKEVSEWMAELGLAKKVEVSRVGNSDLFDVQVTLNDNATLPIADLGYGMSQILPVLVQCSFAPKGSTLLFEQPELHLHHLAAGKLATVLAKVAKQRNLRIVAETHSEDLFKQLLIELNTKKVSINDVIAYKVARVGGKSVFEKIIIDEDESGKFECDSPWTKDISGS
jgi:predicted ATP-dependent endonuclease of OLD family